MGKFLPFGGRTTPLTVSPVLRPNEFDVDNKYHLVSCHSCNLKNARNHIHQASFPNTSLSIIPSNSKSEAAKLLFLF
jgi:hypothetical protein